MASDLLKVGALWVREGKDSGKKYMSGEAELNGETVRLTVFKNSFKKEEKHPDYIIYIDAPEEPKSKKGKGKGKKEAPEPDDTDIPF